MKNQGKTLSSGEIKVSANSLISVYRKGVELVGKILTQLILLQEIFHGEEIDEMKTYLMSLNNKLSRFNKLSVDKYPNLNRVVDREIRNAEAHMNIRFSLRTGKFRYKVTHNKKKRIEIKEISVEEMVLKYYPMVCSFIQAYYYSSALLFLSGARPDDFREIITRI